MRTHATLAALALAASALVSGCASSGSRGSEKVSIDIRGTVDAVDACGSSRQASLASLKNLVGTPHDGLAAKFETFDACVNRVVSDDSTLRGRLATMKSSGNARFEAWGAENLSYADNDMQVRSQESRAEASEAFQLAVKETDAMLVLSAAFVAYLSDIRSLIANDLSSRGVDGASEFAKKARSSNGDVDDQAVPARKRLGAAAEALSSHPTSK